jgi:hypothetical protein
MKQITDSMSSSRSMSNSSAVAASPLSPRGVALDRDPRVTMLKTMTMTQTTPMVKATRQPCSMQLLCMMMMSERDMRSFELDT